MEFRFHAHDARTGEFLHVLPTPAQAQIGDVFGERGTLELTYSAHQARAVTLPTFVEVRVQVQYDGGEWGDVGPAFIRLGGSHEGTDAAGMRKVTFVGREWLLGRARVSAGDTSVELIDGKRPFYQATAGEIMRTLLLEAKDRGAAAGIDLSGFTNTRDTAGNLWSERVTIYYSPGLPIGDVLQNLVDQGLCDYRMNGRVLELYEPETTLGRDLTTGADPVRIHGAVSEAPDSYTLEDLTTSALLIGEEGFQVEVDNPSAPDEYGRLEVTIEQGGVNSEGTARTLIDAELQRGSREIREITRTQHSAGARALPYRDYRCGDFVQVHDQGAWVRYRVRELQLVREDGGWTIHTVLNDRLQELLLRLAKKQNGIVNGSRGSGGDGTRPAPAPKPGVEPAAPQGLVVDQQVYLDASGTARGLITAGWGEVTQSTSGLAIDIGGYELWWRVNDTFAVWTRAAVTSGDTEVDHSPVVLEDGDGAAMEYQWRVRAIARESNRPGPWSSIVTLTMTQDTTPPPLPSLPVVETGFRIVTVAWDGLDENGLPMPRDFAWTRIYLAATESMADARRVGSLGHPGSWNSDTMPADTPVWVALTAVDRVGNESPMTPAVSVTPQALVDEDAIREQLDGLADGTLIEDDAITSPKILAGAITAEKIAALAIEADHLAANAITADKIAAGAIDGKVITGATIRTNATGARVQMTSQGFYAYNPSNAQTFSIDANTGAVNITGNLTQENSYGDLRVGPAIYNASGEGDATPAVALRRTGSTYYGVAGVALTGGSGSEHLVVQGPLAGAGQGSWVVLPQAGYGSAGITRSFAVGDTSFFRLNTAGDARMEARTGPYVGAFAGGYANLSNGDGTYFQAASGNNAHVEAAGGSVYLRSKVNASADYSRAHISLLDSGAITLRTQQTASSNVRGGYINLNTDGVGVYAGAGASGVAARNLWLRAYGNAYLAAFSTGANASAQAYVDLLDSGTTYWQGSRMYISTLPASSGAVPIGRVSGQLHSVSSSRKYKLLEEPIDARDSNLEDKLLSIPVKTWVDRTAAERLAAHHTAVANGEDPQDDLVGCGTLERFPGVVAEDLHDAGLNMFVGYEDGEPEWVLYDRIGPALIPIIRRLRDRVDALETQIGATP